MVEIIPAIIAKDFKELEDKIKLVEPYVKTVQLDVMDGIFVSNKTWPYAKNDREPFSVQELYRERFSVNLEAHLMVDSPHRVLNEWLASKVKRVILHWEAIEKIHNHELLPYKTQVSMYWPVSNLAQEAHKYNKEFGVALKLETPVSVLEKFISHIDMVLLMSVKPGQGGQKFQADVIPKIIALRQRYGNVKIGVDGGISLDNTEKLVKAGADFLVMGSAIFESVDPGAIVSKAYEKISGIK